MPQATSRAISSSNTNYTSPPIEPAAVSSLLKMRCPKCQKLYSVQSEHLRQANGAVRFNCVGCQAHFNARLVSEQSPSFSTSPQRLLRIETFEVPIAPKIQFEKVPQVDLTEATVSELRCPKCGSRNSLSSTECRFCGVVIAKAKVKGAAELESEIGIGVRADLNELWESVLSDYENVALHNRFIMACDSTGAMQLAGQKYSRILQATPGEEIAKQMRARIVGLTQRHTEFVKDSPLWNYRVPGFNDLILIFGGFLLVLGLMLPSISHLAGVGVAAISLGLGVRFFLRPQR